MPSNLRFAYRHVHWAKKERPAPKREEPLRERHTTGR